MSDYVSTKFLDPDGYTVEVSWEIIEGESGEHT